MNKYINPIFFLFYLFSRPRLFLLLFKKIYLPVYIQYEWIKKYNINTFIDIGASQGRVSRVIHYFFPSAIIYAFEPLPTEFKNLKKYISSPNIILNNIALSDSIGKTVFYINNHAPSSSMLKVSKDGKNLFPFLHKYHKVTVNKTTLDSYFKNRKIKKNIFLKIDVQGAEKMVFEGGLSFLKNVSIIHVETSFEEIYNNQCLFADIYKFLTNIGFVYVGNVKESEFFPYFKLPIQENSIFIRKP